MIKQIIEDGNEAIFNFRYGMSWGDFLTTYQNLSHIMFGAIAPWDVVRAEWAEWEDYRNMSS